jgi:hypothetical protein
LRLGELRAAFGKFLAHARGPDHVAQALRKQRPLRRALDKEVGRAGFIGTRNRCLVVEPSQHQDRYVLAAGEPSQSFAGDEAVDIRHECIQHDDVRLVVRVELQCTGATIGLDHAPLPLSQCGGRQQPCHRIVVDQQHQVGPL